VQPLNSGFVHALVRLKCFACATTQMRGVEARAMAFVQPSSSTSGREMAVSAGSVVQTRHMGGLANESDDPVVYIIFSKGGIMGIFACP